MWRPFLTEAHEYLAAGNSGHAARLLTDAAHGTHDPAIQTQVRELAEHGLERAGSFLQEPLGRDHPHRRPRRSAGVRLQADSVPMSDLVMTRQFVEQAKPEVLR